MASLDSPTGVVQDRSLRRPYWRAAMFYKALALVGLVSIFIADTSTPLGFAHGTLYPLIILIVALSERPWWIVAMTIAGILFTGLGFWLSLPAPPDFPLIYVLANRLLSMVAIAITGGLTLVAIKTLHQIQRSQALLVATHQSLTEKQQLLEIASRAGQLGGWKIHLLEPRLEWSDEVAHIHGVEPGFSPTLEQAFNFYAPKYQKLIRDSFRACAEEGLPFDEELQIITTQGCSLWVRAIGQPVHDQTGRIIAVQGAFQDINRRKMAETSLVASEQRFRQLSDAMPLIVWTAEPDGTVDYASQVLRDYTGIQEPAPHPSQYWLSLLHPDDREPCIKVWLHCVQTESNYSFEFRLRRYDQTYHWHLVQAVPIRDEQGAIVKWYGTAIDIHDQKQNQQKTEGLANRLNTILESITDAFLAFDRQWNITFINRQGEHLLQCQRQDVIGKNVWEVFPEAVGSIFQEQYEKAFSTQESVHFQALYPPLDCWFDIHAYPSSEGLAIYFQDISDRRALEEQLRQSQRLESIGQLTGGVAHDFNNLLTVILGNAELITDTLGADHQLYPLAEMITAAALRGAELTQRLLAFARRQVLEPKPVNVNELVNQMKALLQRTLGEHIHIECLAESDLWIALIDPTQLENALLNLCLNARDAMAYRGQLTIETGNIILGQDYIANNANAEVPPGEYIMIAVSDIGTGIDPANLNRVFEPFFTTKARGKGTGLGLSMVYGFIKQSQGHIKIYSEPGEGTTVKMYLPRYRQELVDAADSESDPMGHILGHQERILVVEDDPLVLRYAKEQLEHLGYQVITANNGPEALRLLQKQVAEIDLLFTDVIMAGGMSGRDVVEAAQQLRPDLKILYTSGYTENAIMHHGRLDPGVQLLSKPYGRKELAEKVHQVLSG
ncbi:PAS domain-containing protein [Candidatus Synechococcus calcipolaris G9]|uniref:histidine kinase n=1 Tax=Candidatus Synechococcus calcipolaris G9 TaxID=1497997 RepID=A0ABT6F1Q0_9SYNE|nr:PAS domain-containing protein [Candidatus Synechococcus calcipolaris]MDG2991785.1 PAS domain-containing protein [Candidatus Synechococcus calcipolaris G9]